MLLLLRKSSSSIFNRIMSEAPTTSFPTTLFGEQTPMPLIVQKRLLGRISESSAEHPFVIAHLHHSHTDPDDFAKIVDKGIEVVIASTGVVLQNLAIRVALNRFSPRPLNLWLMGASQNSKSMNDYLLGEEIEAAITGSDGVVFTAESIRATAEAVPGVDATDTISSNCLNAFKAQMKQCRSCGLSTSLLLFEPDLVGPLLNDPDLLPDMIFFGTKDTKNYELFIKKHNFLKEQLSSLPAPPPLFPFASIRDDQVSFPRLPLNVGYSTDNFDLLPSKVVRPEHPPLVKVCGIKTVDAAKKALDSGASMVGMILVPGRNRTVDLHTAEKISALVRGYKRGRSLNTKALFSEKVFSKGASVFDVENRILRIKTASRPMIVGVFRNQPLEEVLYLQHHLQLDMVQLHGGEPMDWCRIIPVPVIKRFTPGSPDFANCSLTGYHYLSLIDGEIGGEGKLQDWAAIKEQADIGARFLMAGGITEHNVEEALQVDGIIGVDVSGGVESNGVKDMGKIERFVKAASKVRTKY